MPVSRPVGFIQQHHRRQSEVQNQSVQMTEVSGRLLVKDPGEVAVDVNFPVYFTERPAMSFGAEMDENFVPVDGCFPTISVVVLKWYREEREDEAIGRFIGAQLGIVTTGISGQQMWVHWNGRAKALRNPVRFTATAPSMEDEI